MSPTSNFNAVLQIVMMLLALALVLFLAWFILRWMNKRVPGMGGTGNGKFVKVLERVPTGKSGSIMLIRVENKVILVAVTEHAVEKLCEFDDPEGNLDLPVQEFPSFASALKDAGKKFSKKKDGGDTP